MMRKRDQLVTGTIPTVTFSQFVHEAFSMRMERGSGSHSPVQSVERLNQRMTGSQSFIHLEFPKKQKEEERKRRKCTKEKRKNDHRDEPRKKNYLER